MTDEENSNKNNSKKKTKNKEKEKEKEKGKNKKTDTNIIDSETVDEFSITCSKLQNSYVPSNTTERIVYKYMLENNRPYSAQMQLENLHNNSIKKSDLLRALDTLCEKQVQIEKVFTKFKIYFVNQDIYPEISSEYINKIDDETIILEENLSKLRQKYQTLLNDIQNIDKEPNTDELPSLIEQFQTQYNDKNTLVNTIENKRENLPKDILQSTHDALREKQKLFLQHYREWKRRKNICDEMSNLYLENVSKSRQEFYEELGLDMDEDNKVNIKDYSIIVDRLTTVKR